LKDPAITRGRADQPAGFVRALARSVSPAARRCRLRRSAHPISACRTVGTARIAASTCPNNIAIIAGGFRLVSVLLGTRSVPNRLRASMQRESSPGPREHDSSRTILPRLQPLASRLGFLFDQRFHTDNRDLRRVRFCHQFSLIEHERAPGVHSKRGRIRLDHYFNRPRPDHRHVEQQVSSTRRRFDQSQSLPFHQTRRSAQHRVRSFHRLERHARAVGDSDALPQVEAGERVGDLPAVFDVALLVRIRFPFL